MASKQVKSIHYQHSEIQEVFFHVGEHLCCTNILLSTTTVAGKKRRGSAVVVSI